MKQDGKKKWMWIALAVILLFAMQDTGTIGTEQSQKEADAVRGTGTLFLLIIVALMFYIISIKSIV